MTVNIGILLFDEAKVLDVAGPFEVFSAASRLSERSSPSDPRPFRIFTIGREHLPVALRGGLGVVPEFSFDGDSGIDVSPIPGGFVDITAADPATLHWISRSAD